MHRCTGSRMGQILVLAAMAVGAAGMGGCVSQGQYDRLHTALDEANSQLASDQHELDALRRQLQAVQAQLDEKDRLLGLQGGGVQALQSEIQTLRAQLAKLQGRYNKLLALAGRPPSLPESVSTALEQLAGRYPDLLQFDPKRGLVRFKSDLTFDSGSTTVKPRARRALAQFARILDMPVIAQNEIRIVGNTDDVPVRHTTRTVMNPNNWYLSTNRAISVLSRLKRDGVQPARMQAAGWGKFHPIARNKPNHRGSAQNRRVDIYILPQRVHVLYNVGGGNGGGARMRQPRHTAPQGGNQGGGGGGAPPLQLSPSGGGGGTSGGNGNVPVPTPQ